MIALLKLNVLIALFDPDHDFHRTAKHWVLTHARLGRASCPLTQNGCVRIVSQPNYWYQLPLVGANETLQNLCQSPHHPFWSDDVSLLDATAFDHSKTPRHRQLTDLYLLALAVKHQGRFVTLDGALPLDAAQGARRQHLVVL